MSSALFRRWACPAALLLTVGCATSDGQSSKSMVASDAAAASESRPPVVYRSAFDGYRPDKEAEADNWKRANDTVHTIGGWRSYARESAAAPTGAPR
ncbi:MAG: hypothetical protein ACREBN_05670 [Burkholderiaceae bacterium]